METKDIKNISDQYLMNTYGRVPISMANGYDSTLVDEDGKEYLDFLSGIAVMSLGYSNDNFKNALKNQIDKITHTSNIFLIENQAILGKMLVENSFADRAFFSNSGAEANEGAIKLARRFAFFKYGPEKNEVIASTGAFHGRTLMTLQITDTAKYKEGCGPDPDGFYFAEFNNIESYRALASKEKTAAIIIEPVQGEGGVYPADETFLKQLRELCDELDISLIFDEVQCGLGRTGSLFAYEYYGVTPDIMTLAKALGNGIPIGAILATQERSDAFKPGSHGTTFGGNHLATAAGIASLTEILDQDLSGKAKASGEYFKTKLDELKNKYDFIVDVRGRGLLVGMELNMPGSDVVKACLDNGFIINCTHEKTLRFLPPLIIKNEEIDALVNYLNEYFKGL